MKPTKTGVAATFILVSLAVLILLPALVNPLIASSRRMQCQSKQKAIAAAVNIYQSVNEKFPPSCHVDENGPGKDGYSFLVDILPMMEQETLWKQVDIRLDESLARPMPIFRCPASKTPPLVTNYKAVSASTRAAYEVSSRTDIGEEGLDIYGIGVKATESDAVMYVGSRTTLRDIKDGVSFALLLTETEEPIYSRWIVGQECGLYTMTDDAEFQGPDSVTARSYVSPAGYTASNYGIYSTIPAEKQKTNLDRDYAKSPYPWGETGFFSEKYGRGGKGGETKLGPSSAHYGVVIHAFTEGRAESFSKGIDPAAYFFMTTRSGGDPQPLCCLD